MSGAIGPSEPPIRTLAPLIALLLLLGPASAQPGEPEAPCPTCDVSSARVLASPGWPGALRAFLPPGSKVEPLALPLPPGPLLLLGLTGTDPTARALGELLLGLDAEGDLGGGYVAAAWMDGARAVGALFAEDAAALAAARFELETFTPEPLAGAERSVEFTKPDEQGGVRMALGRRQVRPRFRWRGTDRIQPLPPAHVTAMALVAAHANRVRWRPEEGPGPLRRLREHGVLPVADVGNGDPRLLREAQQHGIRHLALTEAAASTSGAPWGWVEDVARAARPGGLDELLVFAGPQRVALGDVPSLGHVPEALLVLRLTPEEWRDLTRSDLERVGERAGVPVVLAPLHGRNYGSDLPSLERPLPPECVEVVEGIEVRTGGSQAPELAALWAPLTDEEAFPERAEVWAALPLERLGARAFLEGAASRLVDGLAGRVGGPDWLHALPARLRTSASSLPADADVLLAPWVPEPVVLDGRLDDRAWAYSQPRRIGPVDVLALSDGSRLVLGVHVPDAAQLRAASLSLVTDGHARLRIVRSPVTGGWTAEPGARMATARRGAADEVEVAFEREVLSGRPDPTRVFALDVLFEHAHGTHRLGASGPGAVLVTR